MPEPCDEEIAGRVQSGDVDAFAILVERYESKMLRYARKFLFGHEDAQDLVQQVFLKAYVNMKSFNTTRRFSPWLYRIAHNEFLNTIKKRGHEPILFFDPDTLFPHPIAKERPDREHEDQELRVILEECLHELDAKYREPLILYFFEELSYQEIADIIHIPVSTVGIRLKRGKDKLRRIYDSHHRV